MSARLILLTILAVVSTVAQDSVSGFWLLKIPTGDGNFRELFLDLKQNGDQVTGEVLRGTRKIPITEGSFRNGRVHLVTTTHFQGETRQTVYEGTLEKGALALTVQYHGREPDHGVAERSRPEAALPPARLPPPELRDVPDNGLARTPPMGWNSWNKFAGKVDDAAVRGMADAMVSSGMSGAGYVYVNIDDTWEGPRDPQGNITTNRKFPDMKALADYVHSKGLKIGIYSSPGPKTCAGYPGSYGHEEQDARQWAAWGIDYLKYDWCSAGEIYKNEDMQAVYQKMGDALRNTGRPIVYSLCQYGLDKVWTWGPKVGGNLWRTTGDISDNWKSMSGIGFNQFAIAPFIGPGHWNDPDMLEIGNGGMSDDEYRTHMSLWSMLAAPLLAGNDLRSMSAATKVILMNTDVIAVDQDAAAQPVKKVSDEDGKVVLTRPLADGSTAVGLFNRADAPATITVDWAGIGLGGRKLSARDLWRHEAVDVAGDHYSAEVPRHGVVMLRVKAE
ncbi:MAG TPA: glycoside hydrolase family 27 protein [Bryobacteraceae bacterium]|nr:glycoside hydrolase family 27 protein [Bryobacteraceae bacterium]